MGVWELTTALTTALTTDHCISKEHTMPGRIEGTPKPTIQSALPTVSNSLTPLPYKALHATYPTSAKIVSPKPQARAHIAAGEYDSENVRRVIADRTLDQFGIE